MSKIIEFCIANPICFVLLGIVLIVYIKMDIDSSKRSREQKEQKEMQRQKELEKQQELQKQREFEELQKKQKNKEIFSNLEKWVDDFYEKNENSRKSLKSMADFLDNADIEKLQEEVGDEIDLKNLHIKFKEEIKVSENIEIELKQLKKKLSDGTATSEELAAYYEKFNSYCERLLNNPELNKLYEYIEKLETLYL